MLKVFILIGFWTFFNASFGQDVEGKLIIRSVDSQGNRDSVLIGFHPNATDGIDGSFEEMDISDRLIDSVLDIRIIHRTEENTLPCVNLFTSNYNFELKTDIRNTTWEERKKEFSISIKAKYLPVSLYCDVRGLLNGASYKDSFFELFEECTENDNRVDLDHLADMFTFRQDSLVFQIEKENSFLNLVINKPIVAMEEQSKETIFIGPNPFSDKVVINCRTKEEFWFQIYNVTGKIVYSGYIDNCGVNLAHLKNGVYFIKYQIDDKVVSQTLIKE